MLHPLASVRIARATAADAPRLVPIFEAYRAFYRKPPAGDASLAFLSERLRAGESAVFLALAAASNPCDEPAVVGFAQLYPTFSSVNLRRIWTLNDLFVVEAYRRRGVARQLIAAAIALARETSARSLALLTEEANAPAQALYESLGWTHDTVYRRYTLTIDA